MCELSDFPWGWLASALCSSGLPGESGFPSPEALPVSCAFWEAVWSPDVGNEIIHAPTVTKGPSGTQEPRVMRAHGRELVLVAAVHKQPLPLGNEGVGTVTGIRHPSLSAGSSTHAPFTFSKPRARERSGGSPTFPGATFPPKVHFQLSLSPRSPSAAAGPTGVGERGTSLPSRTAPRKDAAAAGRRRGGEFVNHATAASLSSPETRFTGDPNKGPQRVSLLSVCAKVGATEAQSRGCVRLESSWAEGGRVKRKGPPTRAPCDIQAAVTRTSQAAKDAEAAGRGNARSSSPWYLRIWLHCL